MSQASEMCGIRRRTAGGLVISPSPGIDGPVVILATRYGRLFLVLLAAGMISLVWPFPKKAPAASSQQPDQWQLRTGTIDGRPSIIRINASADTIIHSSEYATCVTIDALLNHPDERGFPAESELDGLAAIEDDITASFRSANKSILAAVVTRDSTRRFVLYTADTPAATAASRLLVERTRTHRLTTAFLPDPNREEYGRLMGPSHTRTTRLTDSGPPQGFQADDQQVVNHLYEAGSDLSVPHPIEHYLYFPTEKLARSSATLLDASQYSIDVRPPTEGYTEWLVHVAHDTYVRPESLGKAISDLRTFATNNGGIYDGWEAQVIRNPH